MRDLTHFFGLHRDRPAAKAVEAVPAEQRGGILARMTPDQRRAAAAYRGPETTGTAEDLLAATAEGSPQR